MSPAGTAVITGASSGIGAVYADRLAARGHDLVLVARSSARLEAVAARIRAAHGVAVRTVIADLTRAEDRARVETLLAEDGSITLLVNNAGIAALSPLVASDVARLEEMIAINVTAPMRLSHAILPGLLARGAGTIINISSVAAIGPEILNGVYGGTKAFVLAFSQSLHKEVAGSGVRIQVVLPGATATEIWETDGPGLSALPAEIVMSAGDLVDAALLGLDRGEFASLPSLHDGLEYAAWEAARQMMLPHLSSATVAPRYRTPAEV